MSITHEQNACSFLSAAAASSIRNNVDELADLIEDVDGDPTRDPFPIGDAATHSHIVRILRGENVIRLVERRRNESNLYVLASEALEIVEEVRAQRPESKPCEHSGFRNLGDGEYTCSHDTCDVRFDRETAEAIVAEREGSR